MNKSFSALFIEHMHGRGLTPDASQNAAAGCLEELTRHIDQDVRPNLFKRWRNPPPTARSGAYVYGPVGRGKTMIMDDFYAYMSARTSVRRQHFYAFMSDVHDWLHENRGKRVDNLLPMLAANIAKETKLICLDEFFVEDVADAMILSRLFSHLFQEGVYLVTTSNCAPENLYEGGLQRELFLPFIAVVQQRMTVINMAGGRDYREGGAVLAHYTAPLSEKNITAFEGKFIHTAATDVQAPFALSIGSRQFEFTSGGGRTLLASFEALCGRSMAGDDYFELARQFDHIFIGWIPAMNDTQRNEVRRFITLIDILYDEKIDTYFLAAVPLEGLYSGDMYAFEFQRTLSRIQEMAMPDPQTHLKD